MCGEILRINQILNAVYLEFYNVTVKSIIINN